MDKRCRPHLKPTNKSYRTDETYIRSKGRIGARSSHGEEADWLAKGYGSFATAWRTLQGIEAMQMIRKGRVRWIPKDDSIAQASFIGELFGIAA